MRRTQMRPPLLSIADLSAGCADTQSANAIQLAHRSITCGAVARCLGLRPCPEPPRVIEEIVAKGYSLACLRRQMVWGCQRQCDVCAWRITEQEPSNHWLLLRWFVLAFSDVRHALVSQGLMTGG